MPRRRWLDARVVAQIEGLLAGLDRAATPRRVLGLGVAAGILPLLMAWATGWPGHRLAAALLLFPAFVALVRSDRDRLAFAMVLSAFVAHSLIAIALARFQPDAAAALLTDGQAYWQKNLAWLRTGVDPDRTPAEWLPIHARQALGMAVWGFTSLGAVALERGLYELDLMNFFVGRLVDGSRSAALALVVGWHPWAIARGIAYVRIVFEMASRGLVFLLGVEISTPERRRRRWAWGLGLLALDIGLKLLATDWVRRLLAANLA